MVAREKRLAVRRSYRAPLHEILRKYEGAAGRPDHAQVLRAVKTSGDVKRFLVDGADHYFPVMIDNTPKETREAAAMALHLLSSRFKKPFMQVDCATLQNLLRAQIELFGLSEGDFRRPIHCAGLVEKADGGTLFIDNIDRLPLIMQEKLLEVMKTNQVICRDGETPIAVNVRVVIGLADNVINEIGSGKVKGELFELCIGKQREAIERGGIKSEEEEIIWVMKGLDNLKISDFIRALHEEALKRVKGNKAAAARLLGIERTTLFERLDHGYCGLGDPKPIDPAVREAVSKARCLEEDTWERLLISEAMERAELVKAKAARLLGLKRTTLVEKLKTKGTREGNVEEKATGT